MPWFPNDSHLFMFSLANEHTCTPEENVCHPPVSCCVTGQVCVAESHRNWQRLYESLLPPTIHETGPPEMNSDWSAGIKMKVVFFLVLLIFFGRTCFTLATSSRWYCPDYSDITRPNVRATQAWVSHSVPGLWNHISARNVTFLVVAHFNVSRWSVVIRLCLWNFYMQIKQWAVRQSPCCHGGYWGMVHWLCIWKSQAKTIPIHYWYIILLKTVNDINFNVMITLSKHWKYPYCLTSLTLLTHLSWTGATKLKQCKQTTGPESVIWGAEMHPTGGRNPSYHVIIAIVFFIESDC